MNRKYDNLTKNIDALQSVEDGLIGEGDTKDWAKVYILWHRLALRASGYVPPTKWHAMLVEFSQELTATKAPTPHSTEGPKGEQYAGAEGLQK